MRYATCGGVENAITNNWTAKVEALNDNSNDYAFNSKKGNGGSLVRVG